LSQLCTSPVQAAHFESHLAKLQVDSSYLLSEEFLCVTLCLLKPFPHREESQLDEFLHYLKHKTKNVRQSE